MAACPSCGFEYEGSFKFCPECAAPLGVSVRQVAEERKVVSVVFCDLVGFTASSENADPEDVDKMLSAYAVMARLQIEAHGGVVEKFIGDAVVGVFGVPAAHEDDPERAVRAGLRIAEGAEELVAVGGAPLRLRVGVNTGETLVRLGANPGSGERVLAGDAINTASRLQSVAPEMGVAVGISTFEATSVVFDYVELEPATLKGKSEPVRVFHARSPRARFGTDLTRTHDSPFIGREIDLAMLKGVFDKTVAASSVQLVTVVGEPGLGKSRLVAELFAYTDGRPELVTWRQGRCLPYGEGITFWALGEILKAHTGILESDPPMVARDKLDAVLPEGEEREWFKQRLLPLLGIEATSSAEREELFTAWRRFLEGIADDSPTVLVFEDLHWADEAMLAFLEHLADLAEGVPLLLVGTARPELYERHPHYTDGMRNANTISLAPLTDEETARLVSALLDAAVIPAELQQPILERAGGNPLYAEEFVRLLRDRDLLFQKGSSWELKEGAEVPFPDSVQALIAARLDTLEPDAKSLLADAAVIGKVFWAGAVTQMGDRDPQTVTATLRELSRKELVRPSRQSSMEGEAEYAFWHVLARDVAYNQLPRASRATRHVAAAKWIESKAPDRVEDLADVLAYHYTAALDLATAAGNTDQAAELHAPALRFLILAGERALGLDTTAALASLDRALALTRPGHAERGDVLALVGRAQVFAGHNVEAREALEEAIATRRADGDLVGAALLLGLLGIALRELGDPRWNEVGAEALPLLEQLPPGPDLVKALGNKAVGEVLMGRHESGIAYADRALALCAELGLPPDAHTLGFRGLARSLLGDRAGIEEQREAIALATQAGNGWTAAVVSSNFGGALWAFEGPEAAIGVWREAIAFANARGIGAAVKWASAGLCEALVDHGEFHEALELASEINDRHQGETGISSTMTRLAEARVMMLRGQTAEVASSLDWLEETLRADATPEVIVLLAVPAAIRAVLAQPDQAAELLVEIDTNPVNREDPQYATCLPMMVRTALSLDKLELARRLVANVEPRHPITEHALTTATAALAEANGDHQTAADGYADAAQRWQAFGVTTEQAFALLGQGRCLVALGRPADATQPLLRARDIFQKLQATPALAETDALLQQATALSS